jgi:hypothetical protein
MNETDPHGARQALATGASTLLLITVAFATWWTFATDGDAGLVLGLAILAFIALTAVPALAAQSPSLRPAKVAYAMGALLALAVLVAAVSQAFGPADPADETDPPDPQVRVGAPALDQAGRAVA